MSQTTLTTELQRKIVARVRQGAYPETAALSLGVSTATFRRWIRQGESTRRGTYREFYLAVYRAQSCAEIEVTLRVRRLAVRHALTSLRILERRFPDRWSAERDGATATPATAAVAGAAPGGT